MTTSPVCKVSANCGNICILSADHSDPLHNQLPSRYRSHKASYSNFSPKIGCIGNVRQHLWAPIPSQHDSIEAHNPNGISIGSAVFAGLTSVTDRSTDHATRSVRIGRIYVRSTAMRPNKRSATYGDVKGSKGRRRTFHVLPFFNDIKR